MKAYLWAFLVSAGVFVAPVTAADEPGVIDSDQDREHLLGGPGADPASDDAVPQDIRRASGTLDDDAATAREGGEDGRPLPKGPPEAPSQVVGRSAVSSEGSAVGTIGRVADDAEGRPAAILLRAADGDEIAIPWERLELSEDDRVIIDMSLDQIAAAPPLAR